MSAPERARVRIAAHRHQHILELLRRTGAAAIGDLVQQLQVSPMTVRRDLDELSKQGLIQRTHGGAVLSSGGKADPPYTQRSALYTSAKTEIATYAAQYVSDGERVILDSGSTVAELAEHLVEHTTTTVITYSLPIIQSLAPSFGPRVVCTGGAVEPSINALIGPLAEQVLTGVRVDKAFLGATSVSVADGFSNSNLGNLALQRIVLSIAREVYLLVDSSKFSRTPFWLVSPLNAVTAVITDSEVSLEIREQFTQAGIPLIIATTAPASQDVSPQPSQNGSSMSESNAARAG